MNQVTFSRSNTPLTILVNGEPVGRIERNYRATAFVVDLRRIYWRSGRTDQKLKVSLRGGQSCVWIKRLKDAKKLVEIVGTAYADRLIK